MIFLLYTGISELIILRYFQHPEYTEICSYVLLMRLSGRGGGARWKRESALGKVGNVCSWWGAGGGVGGVRGVGGETQSWSRAGIWHRCHLRGWPGLLHPALLALLLLLGAVCD